MGSLWLVRHGQTSGPIHDRDRLSELGHAQAVALGKAWADAAQDFRRVYVGPRNRHQQSATAAMSAGEWPEPTPLAGLDEYPFAPLFEKHLPLLAERDASVRELLAGRDQHDPERAIYSVLGPLGRAWARGEIADPGLESWAQFEARVSQSIATMTADAPRGATIAAFTSAGFVAAAVGVTLGLVPEKAFDLSLVIRNASTTELIFSRGRLSLASFNVPLPTADASLLTHR